MDRQTRVLLIAHLEKYLGPEELLGYFEMIGTEIISLENSSPLCKKVLQIDNFAFKFYKLHEFCMLHFFYHSISYYSIFNMNETNETNVSSGKTTLLYVELVYLAQLAILIVLGNILVILAFTHGPRRIRTYTNYFVVNLAVSDMMVGLISVPFWIIVQCGELN